jgi:hypothetical protein
MGININDGLKDEVAAMHKWFATNRAKALYVLIGFVAGLIAASLLS